MHSLRIVLAIMVAAMITTVQAQQPKPNTKVADASRYPKDFSVVLKDFVNPPVGFAWSICQMNPLTGEVRECQMIPVNYDNEYCRRGQQMVWTRRQWVCPR